MEDESGWLSGQKWPFLPLGSPGEPVGVLPGQPAG
jgi:hypothetical protein